VDELRQVRRGVQQPLHELRAVRAGVGGVLLLVLLGLLLL
jgi:hypothetical protein